MRQWPAGARAALVATCAALGVSSTAAPTAAAQRYTRPDAAWVTLATPHFRFHAPRELEAWTATVAERMEAVRTAELRVVGHVPSDVTDVVVDDPFNDANGSAYPFIHGPAIFLWPVPPGPRSFIGNARGWGELLAVHEFAHIAHLTRPSRNRWERIKRALIPGQIGPVATRSPRWVIEGYATYVEGALTGSGRPHAALRSAVLRQWALDGQLPSYGAVSGTGGYFGGSFAYLMGSAYLEYLGAARGDSSITALWRRLSARVNRSFDASFAGVYGESPATLYGLFTARLTADAFAVRARLDSAGLVEGALVQRLARTTGDPALSHDGRHLAIELAGGDGMPSRLVVWRAGRDAARDTVADSAYVRAQRRLLKHDPEDVAAVRTAPLPLRPTAVLVAANGRAYHEPRFFADGRQLLVQRDEPTRADVVRPDLSVWDARTGRVRRVTRGAGVRGADPAPNGRTAAAIRCASGHCDLVQVDLAAGTVRVVAVGTATETWDRPRWSPDGRQLAAAVQRDGRWRIARFSVRAEGTVDGTPTIVSPDDGAERYDPAFTADGRSLVFTAERGGVPNVVALDPANGAERPLTRVTGAALAPEPTRDATQGDAVYYLALTSHGLDLRQVSSRVTPVAGTTVDVTLPAALLPRTPLAALRSATGQRPPVTTDSFAVGPVARHEYGAGPRHYALLPWGTTSPDGDASGLQFGSVDPVGRLTWLLQGTTGDDRVWKGGALRATWRGLRPRLTGELFAAQQTLGGRARLAGFTPFGTLSERTRYRGATIAVADERWLLGGRSSNGVTPLPTDPADSANSHRRVRTGPRGVGPDVRMGARLGASIGDLDVVYGGSDPRRLAFGELSFGARTGRGLGSITLAASGAGSAGHTLDRDWRRAGATAALSAVNAYGGLRLEGSYVAVDRDAPAFERPLVGGAASGLFDQALLGQRLALPALPTGFRTGRQAAVLRASSTTPLLSGALLNPALTGGAALSPYYALVSAGESLDRWARLVGVEGRVTGPFAPFARLPTANVLGGVAYILDAPLRNRTRAYVSVTFVP